MCPMNLNTDQIVTVQRTFPVSREEMFKAWTTVEALEQWFRPGAMQTKVDTLELHVGGAFRFVMSGPENRQVLYGHFLEIEPPERLVFSWHAEGSDHPPTQVTVEFTEHENGTHVRLTHAGFQDTTSAAGYVNGWGSIFDKLTTYTVSSVNDSEN
jgi:uncharacterized protein YndB with AHSA1/START domain